MGNLKYIEEMGVGDTIHDEVTETESEEINVEDDSEESFVQDSEESIELVVDKEDTEPVEDTKFAEMRKQIEGMEKRIADKDNYIQELRDASKQKEDNQNTEAEVDTDEDDDFWSNPEATIKKLNDTVKLQQLQIHETIYANTVEGYWKTVNPDALNQAVATDAEFADKFNRSSEPYRTAYEYLKNKSEEKTKSESSLRDKIKAEILAEMGVKGKKEIPPTINGGSKPKSATNGRATTDGFSSVFGAEY